MPRTFVIDRRIWLRGEPVSHGQSYLLRSTDRKMCCIGIYLKACGVPPEELEDRETAISLVFNNYELPWEAEWLVEDQASSWGADELYDINDDPNMKEADREDRIKQEFARHGVTARFRNDRPKVSSGKG